MAQSALHVFLRAWSGCQPKFTRCQVIGTAPLWTMRSLAYWFAWISRRRHRPPCRLNFVIGILYGAERQRGVKHLRPQSRHDTFLARVRGQRVAHVLIVPGVRARSSSQECEPGVRSALVMVVETLIALPPWRAPRHWSSGSADRLHCKLNCANGRTYKKVSFPPERQRNAASAPIRSSARPRRPSRTVEGGWKLAILAHLRLNGVSRIWDLLRRHSSPTRARWPCASRAS